METEILTVFVCFMQYFVVADITLTTPKQNVPESDFTFTLLSDYGYSVGGSTSITLEVKACQDAYIGLMEVNDNNTVLNCIAIGTWRNSKASIFATKGEGVLTQYDGVLLDCDNYKRFEAKWSNGIVELWATVYGTWTKVLSFSTTETSKIQYLGVSTAIFGTGYWRIILPDSSTAASVTEKATATQNTEDSTMTITMEKEQTTKQTSVDKITFTTINSEEHSTKKTTADSSTVAAVTEKATQTTEDSTMTITMEKEQTTKQTSVDQITFTTINSEEHSPKKTTADPTTSPSATTREEQTTTGKNLSYQHSGICCIGICHSNISIQQLAEEIKQLRETLTVNKKDTTLYLNKLRSADDKRMSAAGIGYVGVAIIAGGLVGIVLVDLPNIVHMFKTMYRNVAHLFV